MLGLIFAAEVPTSTIGSATGSRSAPFAEGSANSAWGPAASAVARAATTEPQVSSEGPD